MMEPAQFLPVKAAAVRAQDLTIADFLDRFTDVRGPFAVQPVAELAPGMLVIVADFVNFRKDVILIAVQPQIQSFAAQLFGRTDEIAERKKVIRMNKCFNFPAGEIKLYT